MGAETRTRKEIAEEFRQKYDPNTGKGRIRKGMLPNDDPDEIIPKHGPRGKSQHNIPLSDRLSHGSLLSHELIGRIATQTRRDNWNDKIGTHLIYHQTIPLVIVDTNVIARAIATKPQADCRKVVDACITGKTVPCVTEPIVFEYLEVVGRGILDDGFRFDRESSQLLDEFLTHCLALTGEPAALPFQVTKDRSDKKFVVAKAIAEENTGRLCCIVSRDGDLLGIGDPWETLIFHPSGFLRSMAAGLLAF